MRFRTRSQEVEAIQWTGDNLEEVTAKFPDVYWIDDSQDPELGPHLRVGDGDSACVGDWIINSPAPTDYDSSACPPDEFDSDYIPVPNLVQTEARQCGVFSAERRCIRESGHDGRHRRVQPDAGVIEFGPIPDLIRTVADYEGLPDGTILEVVESSDETVLLVGDVLTKSAGDLLFGADPLHPSSTFKVIVCSVVRLGGDGQ